MISKAQLTEEYINANWPDKYHPGDEMGGWVVVTRAFRCYSEKKDLTRYYVVKCVKCGRHYIKAQPSLSRSRVRGATKCIACHRSLQADKFAAGYTTQAATFEEGQVVKYFKITKITKLRGTYVHEGVCQICGTEHRKLTKQMTDLIRRDGKTCHMCKLLIPPDELTRKRDEYYAEDAYEDEEEQEFDEIRPLLPGQKYAAGTTINHLRVVRVRKDIRNGNPTFHYTCVCQICQTGKEYRTNVLTDIIKDNIRHCVECHKLGRGELRERMDQYYKGVPGYAGAYASPTPVDKPSVPDLEKPAAKNKKAALTYADLAQFDPDVLQKAMSGKW